MIKLNKYFVSIIGTQTLSVEGLKLSAIPYTFNWDYS